MNSTTPSTSKDDQLNQNQQGNQPDQSQSQYNHRRKRRKLNHCYQYYHTRQQQQQHQHNQPQPQPQQLQQQQQKIPAAGAEELSSRCGGEEVEKFKMAATRRLQKVNFRLRNLFIKFKIKEDIQ